MGTDSGAVEETDLSGQRHRERRRVEDPPLAGQAKNRRRRARMPARRALPPIRTLTVGPGISPGQPAAGSDRVADCNRRFGLSPTPECAASGTWPVCHARSTPMRVSTVGWLTGRVTGLLSGGRRISAITDHGSTSATATPLEGVGPIDRLGLVLLKSAVAVTRLERPGGGDDGPCPVAGSPSCGTIGGRLGLRRGRGQRLPALLTGAGDALVGTESFALRGGAVSDVRVVVNPDKLEFVGRQPTGT